MLDPKNINEIVQKVLSSMPEGIKALPEDIQSNLRETLQSVLMKMDLVTREEFDVQKKVLQRTREKLEKIEAALDSFEQ